MHAISNPDGRAILTDAATPGAVVVVSVPADRTFRNAWVISGDRVVVDMARARDLHRDELRRRRGKMLAELDAAWTQADERSDDAMRGDIAAKRQFLRDCTSDPRIDAAATPEALAAVNPLADVLAVTGPALAKAAPGPQSGTGDMGAAVMLLTDVVNGLQQRVATLEQQMQAIYTAAEQEAKP